jgi:hypothetical protein
LVGGAAALFTLRARLPATEVPAPAASGEPVAAGVAASASAASPGTVVLRVDVEPAGAEVTLDGESIGQGSVRVERARDDASHALVVTADGHEPERRTVSLAGDLELRVTLARSAAGRVAAARPAAPPPRRDATGGPAPAPSAEATAPPPGPATEPGGLSGKPGQPKKRDLDPSDPWAK